MEPARHKLHVAKGDTVRVIRGEHRGKEARSSTCSQEFRVTVEA